MIDLNVLVALVPSLAPYAGIIGAVGYLAAAIATKMPAPQAGGSVTYAIVYRAVNMLGLNLGHAANAAQAATVAVVAPAPKVSP